MENNTVVIDLEKYDLIMNELREMKNYVDGLKDKIVLDADSFCIEGEYKSDNKSDLALKIDRRAVRLIIDRIGEYSVNFKYSNEMSVVGKYELEIIKEEI